MNYLHYQVRVGQEDHLLVNLNEKTDFKFAHILLLDTGNYYKYRIGKRFETKQRVEGAPRTFLEPPYPGTWHVIIELSTPGELRATVDVRKRGI